MKKKIVIIGAKGMLGSDLVSLFIKDSDYEVVAWDREDIDITNEELLINGILAEKPKIIINAVGYNAVDKAEESEEEFALAMKINANAPENLAKIAKKIDAIFVQYISDYIFNGKKGKYVESDKASPISKYGQSKAVGEKKVIKVGGKNYLIRISKLFGKPAKSDMAKKSFFEVMLNLAKEKDELKVVNSERSCFTYTPDLALATKKLIEEKYPYGVYHIVNEGAVTWYEGARKLFDLAKIDTQKIKVIPVGSGEFSRPAKRPVSSVLVNTKFPKLRPYEEAVKEWLKELK